MAKTFRVGLIGYKFMGRAHSNAWRQAPKFFDLKANIEMHTICGRDAAGVQAARAKLGWQFAATDWREVVESPLIDIVDIGTPTFTHAEIAIAALKNGKHVLLEKPMGRDLKECEAIFAAAKKSKRVHMVCHNYRRIPAIALAKRMMEEGALGKIYHFRARYAQDRLADVEFPLDWRLQKETSGSGVHRPLPPVHPGGGGLHRGNQCTRRWCHELHMRLGHRTWETAGGLSIQVLELAVDSLVHRLQLISPVGVQHTHMT